MTARTAIAWSGLRPLAALLVAFAEPAAAVDWSGAGADSNWSTGANWVGGAAPPSANTTAITFGAAGTMFPSVVDAPWTINRLDISGPLPYALSGATITFDGASPQLNILGGVPTIANDLSFLATTTITNVIDFTIAGVPSGTVGMVKAGTGRLTLANPLIYSGTTTVAAGTLRIGNGATGPGLVPGPVVDNAALEFDLGAGSVSTSGVAGTGTVTVLSGSVAGLFGIFTQAGSTTVSGGTLASTIINNSPLVIGAAGTVQTGDSTVGSLAGAGTLFSNGTAVTVGGDNTSTTFTGTLGGAGGLTKVGSGRLILGISAIYSGLTTVNGGTLRFGDGIAGPGLLPAPVVDNAALEFDLGAGAVSISGVTGTGTVTVLSGNVAGLFGGFNHAGSTTVSGGTLGATITNNAPLVVTGSGTVQTGDSTVGSLAGNGTVFSNGTAITVGGDNTSTTFTGTLGGAGGLTKVGTGRLTLAIAGIYSGLTNVNGGTLRFGDGIAGPGLLPAPVVDNAALEFDLGAGSVAISGVGGTGTVTVLSGTVAGLFGGFNHAGSTTVSGGTLAATITNNAPLVIGAAGTVQTGDSTVGSLSGAGTLFTNGTAVTVGGDNTSTTFSGTVNGAGGLTKVGAGALTLSNANTATGTATVSGGSLLLTGTWPGPVMVNAGATLGGTGTVSGPVTINAGGTLSPGLSPGVINTGNLALGGSLVVEIQGATLGTQYDNTNVTGTVNLGGSTLTLAGAYVPAPGNAFTIITNDGADAVTGTFAGLAEGATVTFNGVPLTITYAGGDGNDVVLAAAALAASPIPTLGEWALALLALAFGSAGAAHLAWSRAPRSRHGA